MESELEVNTKQSGQMSVSVYYIKYLAAALLFLALYNNSYCQHRLYRAEVCSTDTNIIDNSSLKIRRPIDSLPTHREVRCVSISDFGIKVDLGISAYLYNKKTKAWLGNHVGPSFGIGLVFRQFNLNARFKPFTVIPNNNLIFGSDTLTNKFLLNPIKIDYYLGYSIDFNNLLSIEPYIGFNKNSFHVINQSDFNKSFSIPESNGVIVGLSLNKYFKTGNFSFFSLFLNYAYSIVDFSKVNSVLGRGYHDFTFGISYKAFSEKTKVYRVD
jgi:hypothetical protein